MQHLLFGVYFLSHCLCEIHLCCESEVKVKVAQLCLTFYDPIDYTVHGILQARIPEWVAFLFSSRSSQQGLNPGLQHCRRILYHLSLQGSPTVFYMNENNMSFESFKMPLESRDT